MYFQFLGLWTEGSFGIFLFSGALKVLETVTPMVLSFCSLELNIPINEDQLSLDIVRQPAEIGSFFEVKPVKPFNPDL